MMTYVFIICKESVHSVGGLALFFLYCWIRVNTLDCLERSKRFLKYSKILLLDFHQKYFTG